MRKPEAVRHTEALFSIARDLAALSGDVNPDGRLVAACDRWMFLHDTRRQIFRDRSPGHRARFLACKSELKALDAEIASTPARTPVGRHAKAEAALRSIEDYGPRPWVEMVRSALLDLVGDAFPVDATARPRPAPRLPRPRRLGPSCSGQEIGPQG
jgi:hypothetical protein